MSFSVTFDKFNASLLNKSINSLKKEIDYETRDYCMFLYILQRIMTIQEIQQI